jgi:xanthine dehydrogenase molybdopterin-binding subunit B
VPLTGLLSLFDFGVVTEVQPFQTTARTTRLDIGWIAIVARCDAVRDVAKLGAEGIDEQLGVIRVTRVVSGVAAGRILNTKTASSQILGSVVWGIGMALHEETLIDHRLGRIMNANIAEYHVPVNADIHDIKVILVDEPDDSNPLGIKGLGEIGIVGVAAAIANAVYHATGKRVRSRVCQDICPQTFGDGLVCS